MLTLSESARADLKEIWSYLQEDSESGANKMVRELSKKFSLIAKHPQMGRRRDDYVVNMRSVPHKKYVIFYFETEGDVEIYRVVHGSRDIETLFDEFFGKL